MPVSYEWAVNEYAAGDDPSDPNANIENVNHYLTYAEAVATIQRLGLNATVQLVRDEGDDANGILDRMWADIIDGRLESLFHRGHGEHGKETVSCAVPYRFIAEVNREEAHNG